MATRSNIGTRSRDIRRALDTVALALEADGYEPEEVGAAMVGFGFSLIVTCAGPEKAQIIANASKEFLTIMRPARQ